LPFNFTGERDPVPTLKEVLGIIVKIGRLESHRVTLKSAKEGKKWDRPLLMERGSTIGKPTTPPRRSRRVPKQADSRTPRHWAKESVKENLHPPVRGKAAEPKKKVVRTKRIVERGLAADEKHRVLTDTHLFQGSQKCI